VSVGAAGDRGRRPGARVDHHGGGESASCLVADINDIRERGRDEGLAAINPSLFAEIERFPRPTIAANQRLRARRRLRAGAGLRHPHRVGHAKFGQPELGLGIIPGAGATQRLPRIVGMGRAKHLILTGDIIDAKQALEIGWSAP
jgi:enoyl-CoA hydratase